MIRLASIGALLLGAVFYVGMRVGAQLTAEIFSDMIHDTAPGQFDRVWDDGYQTGVLVAMSQN